MFNDEYQIKDCSEKQVMAIVNEQKLTVNKQAILFSFSPLVFHSHRSLCRTDIEHDRNERNNEWRKNMMKKKPEK